MAEGGLIMSGEWPLLIFTILGQLAIGTFIMLIIVRSLLGAKIGAKAAGEVTRFGILAVGPVMLVALIASFFHLGSPMLAFNALGNLKTSWLSREILFTGLFFLFWLITYFSCKKEASGQVLSWCTSIIGLIAVFCMAGIYAHSNKPAWTNVNTYLAFFGAAFVMGAIASGAAVAYGAKGKNHEEVILKILRNVSLIALAAIALQLIFLPVYMGGLAGAGKAAQASAQLLYGSYAVPFILKWILSILAGVMVYYASTKRGNNQGLSPNLIYTALGVAILGEVIGRYVFYAATVSAIFGM